MARSIIQITLKKSGILRHDAGGGVFAAQAVGKEIIVGYHYGSLGYEELKSGGSVVRKCGESIMEVKKKTFPKCTNGLAKTVTDRIILWYPA